MVGAWRGIKCPNCTIEHGVAIGDRHPDRCPICSYPYRFTPEQRAEIDRRTQYAPAPSGAGDEPASGGEGS